MVPTIGNRINILFTSVGRRVELLRGFKRAYRELNLKGNIVAIDIDPLAPALREANRTYIVSRLNCNDYIPSLVNICRNEQVSLVFPLIDPDIPILSNNRDLIESTGAQIAVLSRNASEITCDKWLTFQFFKKIGVSTPESWLAKQLIQDPISYPLFVKPRGGSAAKSTFKVNNPKELDFFIDYVPNPIIQEYCAGPEITNDVMCDLDGDVLAIVSRRRIEVRWGEVAKGVTIYDPDITKYCIKIAKALPAVGPITVQCIIKENVPYFTEINARLGGGVPLGIAAGMDSLKLLLAKAAGLEINIPPIGSYTTGLYMTRFDDSFFITEEEYEQMASHRL